MFPYAGQSSQQSVARPLGLEAMGDYSSGQPPYPQQYPSQYPSAAPAPAPYQQSAYPQQQQQPLRYPSQQASGYPPQSSGYTPQASGYPQQQASGYPPQASGYPQQQASGYPPQQQASGYPPQQASGYPQQQASGYPPQASGYPPQASGYPPQASGYPPQASGYPAQQASGYPPQQGAYPAARPQGYSPQQQAGGYRPQSQTTAYPVQSQQSGGYPGAYGQQPGQTSYPQGGQMASMGQGTIRAVPGFNANADAEALRKAMKGLGCNNTGVINVLCARTNAQRQQIALAFKTMYGKDLIKDLRSELSGDFEEVILALMELPGRYDAQQLRKAMEGIGTKESVLIEIMCTRTNEQIRDIKQHYRQMFGRDLERDLSSETSGYFRRLLVSMSAAGRDESMQVDAARAHKDAQTLYKAGEKRLGTDESTFNAVIAAQNMAQLRAVFQEYVKITGHGIETAIQNEFSGDVRDGLLTCVACVNNRPAYFAQGLHDAMKGFGTQDTHLIRIVVTRCELDMVQIKQEFQRMFKKPLDAFIKGDCSGSYKNALIALVNGN